VITSRPYEVHDKEACLDIFRSNSPKFFAEHEEKEFTEYLEKPGHYFILEQNQRVFGCGGYVIVDQEAYLAWGMVHRSQHGTGLGKRLLLERLSLITQRQDVKQIKLDTSQHTFGFFEKLGFITKKITDDGYASGLHRYDMVLVLDERPRKNIQEKFRLLLRTKGFTNRVINNQEEND
jgi:ribosomal protein S18 acetylase RimI-like enzyme